MKRRRFTVSRPFLVGLALAIPGWVMFAAEGIRIFINQH